MLQSKVPNKSWLVFDDSTSIREPSVDVNLPLSANDELIMHKLIDFVRYSQDPTENKDHAIRPAVGLAAPQIGANVNMYYIRIDTTDDETKQRTIIEHALVNPKIIGYSSQLACLEEGEGCLSVANDHEGYVPRSFRILVEGYDYLKQEKIKITIRGYEAIVFQHEQAHLEGKLYYDLIDDKNPWLKKPEWILL
ncbi:peptide deformylase [Spiroplasma eriocheiris]|uniref:Peptide deformylase n=1 Tax=Spiroplasma eriocheiris TaxID=315358 RepID=A0A0H3XMZ4_9MOLU|nr:peptide deformylase [Spiroplasma eriocheiris]AHF58030.1 putative peptide deformylase [Spiroplasma eriocheiris CCTCC M 207170]AKM54472.1 peptide deformylase [Spiroplasma eriocheiris]